MNGGIACVVLVVLIVIGYVLTGHSFSLGATTCSVPSRTGNNASYPTLASSYSGAFSFGAPTASMQLTSIDENQRGAFCGTLVLGTLSNNHHPFTGTLGADNNITFTTTLASMKVPTTFVGVINADGSIYGSSTTPDGYFVGTWAISPVG
jgi:hypothetical protein